MTTWEKIMEKTDHYIKSLESQLEKWRSEIQKFRVIAEVADKDAQIKHYQIIDEITDSIEAFSRKMEILGDESSIDKDKQKDELEITRERIDQAIGDARTKIN